MGKMVGMAAFKANCTRLLREVSEGGESITVTSRGRPVAEVRAAAAVDRSRATFGFLKSEQYRNDWDPEEPACDPDDWEALR